MRIVRRTGMWGVLVAAAALVVGTAHAGNNPNGVVFRSVGFASGEAEISGGQIKCKIPDVDGAIRDGAFAFGLWNTYGFQSIAFPDVNQPFANPCGGWLQVQNNLLGQGIVVERVELRFAIPGSGRLRQFVPTRRRFPVACRDFRSATVFTGAVLNPANSTDQNSSSGAPNVAFLQMVPMVTPQLLQCLQTAYAGISTDMLVSLPLVIRATAVGRADSGEVYRANTARYNLTLRHTCGNGRVDDGEACDPNAPDTCSGICTEGRCTLSGRACASDAECAGTCLVPDDRSECTCVY